MKQLSFDDFVSSASESEGAIVPSRTETHLTLGAYSTAGLQQDDILIPRLRLLQGLSTEVQDGTGRPGEWVLSGNQALSRITIIPVMFARRRELVTEDFIVLCSSNDAVTGYGDPGGRCDACSMAQWSADTRGKSLPPKCSFIYSYIVYVVELHAHGVLEFKRTGLAAGKAINTIAMQRGGFGTFAVTLSASAKQGARGVYYVPVVTPTTVPEDVLEIAKVFGG